MSKRNQSGIVYSTDPDFRIEEQVKPAAESGRNDHQDLRIWLERKGGGKVTTIIRGFTGNLSELQKLEKQLKTICGSGGTVKDHEVIIQGNHRDKILAWLLSAGYKAKKAGG